MTRRTYTHSRGRRHLGAAGFVLAAALSMAQAPAPDALEQARLAYNAGAYAEAIRLAGEAGQFATWADRAAVVLARAHLERFREVWDRADLDAARTALRGVQADELDARDHVEYLTALGELLFLDSESTVDDRFSAAAELFEVALVHADALDSHGRDVLFDWWAGALDRQAQRGPEMSRAALYERIVVRADEELARDRGSIAASYWLAAAASGAGDTARAVGAAMAAWMRAGSLGERGEPLRLDIERLMLQVILPARAIDLARGADPGPLLGLLEAQWREFRDAWRSSP